MDIDNLKTQMKKGVVELCVLGLLQKGKYYPADILIKLKSKNINIPEGTLYPILTRLRKGNYLTYEWVESVEGPPRKYFIITAKGKIFFKQLAFAWKELYQSANQLIK